MSVGKTRGHRITTTKVCLVSLALLHASSHDLVAPYLFFCPLEAPHLLPLLDNLTPSAPGRRVFLFALKRSLFGYPQLNLQLLSIRSAAHTRLQMSA